MLELAHSQVEKGHFELRLEGEGPIWAQWFFRVGQIKARVLALALILFAAVLNVWTGPAVFFFEAGWVQSTTQAVFAQSIIKWGFAALGFLVWMGIFMLRQEELTLNFDRMKNQLTYQYLPQWTMAAIDEGSVGFDAISQIQVHGPQREPKTPHGFIELYVMDPLEKREKTFRFKLLTDEQFQFYPVNLSRLTGREPTGDWVEE